MNKIYIVTKYDFVFANIKDSLNLYLDVPIKHIKDLNFLNKYSFERNNVILIFNDNDKLSYDDLKNIKANIIILTKLKIKSLNIANIQTITFPIYIQELLNTIKNTDINKLSSINEYIIPGYKLKLIYEDIKLESELLKKSISMTATEGKILKKLFINYPVPVLKNDISTFDNINIELNSIDTHIFNIRKKLNNNQFCIEIKKENDSYKIII